MQSAMAFIPLPLPPTMALFLPLPLPLLLPWPVAAPSAVAAPSSIRSSARSRIFRFSKRGDNDASAEQPKQLRTTVRCTEYCINFGFPTNQCCSGCVAFASSPTVGISIDEREDIYKELRKDAPPIIVVPVTPINVGNNNGKKMPEKQEKKTGWNIFGNAKKMVNRILGEELGDSDAYDKG